MLQLASPDEFYFTETAVGVSGQGLARLGTKCYLSPLNGQLHKDCQMEVCESLVFCCQFDFVLYSGLFT